MIEFWQQCTNHLSKGLPPTQIKQWILPLVPLGFNEEETEFHISAPSRLKQKWAQQYYAPVIQQFIKDNFNHDARVVVLINAPEAADIAKTITDSKEASEENTISTVATEQVSSSQTPKTTLDVVETSIAPVKQVYTTKDSSLIAQPNHIELIEGIEVEIDESGIEEPIEQNFSQQISTHSPKQHSGKGKHQPDTKVDFIYKGILDVPASLKSVYDATRLNPNHTFANLVVGHSNELAHATAANVVTHIGQMGYNPLFLYGSTGLGKTHLMHAIGNEIFQKKELRKIRYIHANDYYLDVVRSVKGGGLFEYNTQIMQEYQNLDLLLIDDIQFFQNKKSTQEQFFHLFDLMVSKNKQVVISSDTYPKELADIDARLISRFSSGLTIQIEPPELEMRVAILMRKAENHPIIRLTDEAAFFIAKHIRSNIRELEGGLQRVIATATFKKEHEITVDLCKEVLKDVLRVSNGLLTVENIQKTVADFYKIRVADMYSKTRKANIVRARHIAMYLAKELTRKSLPDLGEAFGGRDHSTVHHAVEKITEHRANDRELNHDLHVLEQTLKG
ncbi:chromosomal replication initiator protein DnaA [Pelistega sp. NLN82]|uniref:Chromosomal replication initiator protein DnaA n=1 Tax=Pelistega ratti TaxID=2652177 RepID=A0A6L9Y473_9BURK|nr:chromosomal replication initiator protein DnaA [Pelistega ratti]NEN75260.1 chromosomal replication initiator protein DnaA [Pelistega ratti]